MSASLPAAVFLSIRQSGTPHATEADWPGDWLMAFEASTPAEKTEIAVFVPGVFRPGAGRSSGSTAANLDRMTALVLDYDGDRGVTIDAVESALSRYDRVIYTTFRHTPEAHRFRVVLPLSAPLAVADYERVRGAFHASLDRNGIPVKPLPVGQCYFFHTVRPNVPGRAYHRTGERLDGAAWLDRAPIPPTPLGRTSATSATVATVPPPATTSGSLFAGIEDTGERLERIEPKCAFMRSARERASVLPEPEWRAWLSVLARCQDGRRHAHEIGSAHPTYSPEGTDAKFDRLATEISGPLTCTEIRKISPACEGCPIGAPLGATNSPIQLGRPDPIETPPEQFAAETHARNAATLDAAREAHERAQSLLSAAVARLAKAREARSHARRFALGSDQAVEAATEVVAAQAAVEAARSQVEREKRRLDTAERDQRRAQTIQSAGGSLNIATLLASASNGIPYGSRSNIETILENDPAFADIRYDSFAERCYYGTIESGDADGEKASDIERRYTIPNVALTTYREALITVAMRRRCHPVREYLDGLAWDEVPRLHRLMVDGFGGRGDAAYLEKVGTKLCLSAVGRIYEPGCKVDEVVILAGREGARKSTGLRVLSAGWFSDAHLDISSKDGIMGLTGVWIYELGELDAISRAESTAVKRFISTQVDRFRPPYGATMKDRARQGILVGTTNEREFLGRDGHGDRRFIPVATDAVNVDWIEDYRDQLWAEARVRYEAGERWHYTDEDYAPLRAAQVDHQLEHPWLSQILKYLSTGHREHLDLVDPREILVHPEGLNKPPHQIRHHDLAEVGKVLRGLGAERYHPPPRNGVRPPRCYRLPAHLIPRASSGRGAFGGLPAAASTSGQVLAYPGSTAQPGTSHPEEPPF